MKNVSKILLALIVFMASLAISSQSFAGAHISQYSVANQNVVVVMDSSDDDDDDGDGNTQESNRSLILVNIPTGAPTVVESGSMHSIITDTSDSSCSNPAPAPKIEIDRLSMDAYYLIYEITTFPLTNCNVSNGNSVWTTDLSNQTRQFKSRNISTGATAILSDPPSGAFRLIPNFQKKYCASASGSGVLECLDAENSTDGNAIYTQHNLDSTGDIVKGIMRDKALVMTGNGSTRDIKLEENLFGTVTSTRLVAAPNASNIFQTSIASSYACLFDHSTYEVQIWDTDTKSIHSTVALQYPSSTTHPLITHVRCYQEVTRVNGKYVKRPSMAYTAKEMWGQEQVYYWNPDEGFTVVREVSFGSDEIIGISYYHAYVVWIEREIATGFQRLKVYNKLNHSTSDITP